MTRRRTPADRPADAAVPVAVAVAVRVKPGAGPVGLRRRELRDGVTGPGAP